MARSEKLVQRRLIFLATSRLRLVPKLAVTRSNLFLNSWKAASTKNLAAREMRYSAGFFTASDLQPSDSRLQALPRRKILSIATICLTGTSGGKPVFPEAPALLSEGLLLTWGACRLSFKVAELQELLGKR